MSKPRVLIFGLDGATFTVIDDLVKRGVMPYFGEVMQRGARGDLMSIIPPLTPPAWTTLVTGRSPGNHGIFNFLQYDSPTSNFIRMVSTRQVCTETIWQLVGRHGRRAGSLNFVVHNPGYKVDGYVIPGWIGWRWVKVQSHPADLIKRLQTQIPGLDLKELAMDFNEEEKAIAGTFHEDYLPWIDLHIRREQQWFSILKHQFVHDPTELTGVVFDGVDKLQHLCWPFLDPRIEPKEKSESFQRVRNRCWDYFRMVDGFLKQMVELAGPEAHTWIVSDHGFTGSHEILYINRFFEKMGWLTWNEACPIIEDESHELGAIRPFTQDAFNREKCQVYAPFASNNGIVIPIKGVRGPNGVEPEKYEAFRREVADALLTKCVDDAGKPIVTRVWTRDECFPGPKRDLACDLTVALRDFGNFSVLRSNSVLKPRGTILGCHHPAGVFMALGPGVQAGARIDPITLLDIAPTTLYALGLPVPEDFEGHVARQAFKADWLAAHPLEFGPATTAQTSAAEPVVAKEEEPDEQVMMRLKALGYIE